MTDKNLDAPPAVSEQPLARTGLRTNWRIGMYLILGIMLSVCVGLVSLRNDAVLNALSEVGGGDLTPEELNALGLPNSFKLPSDPTKTVPSFLGWIAILAPLVLFALLERFRNRSEELGRPKAATTQAVFWSFSALMGVSLALMSHCSDPVARLCFVIGALCIGAWIHRPFLERYPSRVGKILLLVSILALASGLRYGSLFMAAVPLFVLGIVAFAALLLDDLRRLGGNLAESPRVDPMREPPTYEALNLYLGLAGLVVSAAALAD